MELPLENQRIVTINQTQISLPMICAFTGYEPSGDVAFGILCCPSLDFTYVAFSAIPRSKVLFLRPFPPMEI